MPENTVFTAWLDRRREAMEDLTAMGRIASTTWHPADLFSANLRFVSLSFGRYAQDVAAWHDLLDNMFESWPNVLSGSRTAAASLAAVQTFREPHREAAN